MGRTFQIIVLCMLSIVSVCAIIGTVILIRQESRFVATRDAIEAARLREAELKSVELRTQLADLERAQKIEDAKTAAHNAEMARLLAKDAEIRKAREEKERLEKKGTP